MMAASLIFGGNVLQPGHEVQGVDARPAPQPQQDDGRQDELGIQQPADFLESQRRQDHVVDQAVFMLEDQAEDDRDHHARGDVGCEVEQAEEFAPLQAPACQQQRQTQGRGRDQQDAAQA